MTRFRELREVRETPSETIKEAEVERSNAMKRAAGEEVLGGEAVKKVRVVELENDVSEQEGEEEDEEGDVEEEEEKTECVTMIAHHKIEAASEAGVSKVAQTICICIYIFISIS